MTASINHEGELLSRSAEAERDGVTPHNCEGKERFLPEGWAYHISSDGLWPWMQRQVLGQRRWDLPMGCL